MNTPTLLIHKGEPLIPVVICKPSRNVRKSDIEWAGKYGLTKITQKTEDGKKVTCFSKP